MTPNAEPQSEVELHSTQFIAPQTHDLTLSPPSPDLKTPNLDENHAHENDHDDDHDNDNENIELLLEPFSPSASQCSEHIPDIEEEREQQGLRRYDDTSLTLSDVNGDPILSNLAKKQSMNNLKSKSNPKPRSKSRLSLKLESYSNRPNWNHTVDPPIATMSSALRAEMIRDDLKYKQIMDDMKQKRIMAQQGKGNDNHAPGYKRVGLGINIPSLAAPSVIPRQTKSSQLRALNEKQTTTPSLTTQHKITALNPVPSLNVKKSQSHVQPHIQRQKSLTGPLNSRPSIVPRQNKTSALRAAGEKGDGLWCSPSDKTLIKDREVIALANKEKGRLMREERRKSFAVGLTSLAKPSVEVKQNKTSALRAAGEKGNAGYRDLITLSKEKESKLAMEEIAARNKEKGRIEREERRKSFAFTTPASNVGIDIQVKQNRSSIMRANGEKGNQGYRDLSTVNAEKKVQQDMQIIAKENRDKAKKEREERRKTMTLVPGSFARPSITPRANKTSLLRDRNQRSLHTSSSVRSLITPTESLSKLPSTRMVSALKVSSADDVPFRPAHTEGEVTKRDVGIVKSLGMPKIVPRLNRTALLRAPNTTTSIKPNVKPTFPTSSSASAIHDKAVSISTPSTKSNPSTRSVPKTPASPGIGPRPTKASLLRAGLGEASS
ncbi:uncharacterized protein IL334_001605 [Kwoniella shivajii]|uniref:TPX2 C-terminal domain-containing protein n=1 Tax=Kwoniella shivajii TaxID=564305 RepID=A0ABZ1CVH1_9TREE|nr:hypothetical protein IL334_001605 [Kwoniella shivajii]